MDTDNPEFGEKCVRFGCGGLFGLAVGGLAVARSGIVSWEWAVVLIVLAVLLCGFLAMVQGDEFWHNTLGR